VVVRPLVDELERRARHVHCSEERRQDDPAREDEAQRRERTHLEPVDADVVPLVDVRRHAERVEAGRDELGVGASVKLDARDKDAVVGVAEVLCREEREVRSGRSRRRSRGASRRTWYTVPPPLFRRTNGISRSRSRARLISFQGFCRAVARQLAEQEAVESGTDGPGSGR